MLKLSEIDWLNRTDFRNGFFLYTLVSEGVPVTPVDNFDAEWAEVEFGEPLSRTSIPTVTEHIKYYEFIFFINDQIVVFYVDTGEMRPGWQQPLLGGERRREAAGMWCRCGGGVPGRMREPFRPDAPLQILQPGHGHQQQKRPHRVGSSALSDRLLSGCLARVHLPVGRLHRPPRLRTGEIFYY